MDEEPIRRRRRNADGSYANGQQAVPEGVRHPRRRRRQSVPAQSVRIAPEECRQNVQRSAFSRATCHAAAGCRRAAAWISAHWTHWRKDELNRRSAPAHRGKRRRPLEIRWSVPSRGRGRDSYRVRRLLRNSAVLRVGCAALLAAAGMALVVSGLRGVVRTVSEKRQNRETEEAILTLYHPEIVESESSVSTAQMAEATETSVPEDVLPAEATPAPAPVFHRLEGEIRQELAALAQANEDMVGWLSISDVLNQPVLYRNNVYYESHDFYGQESIAGAIFLDYNHRLTPNLQNALIHGHNMKDGSMFGILLHYRTDIDFLRGHGIVHFDTLYEEDVYAIFAVMIASFDRKSARYFDYYTHPEFASSDELNAYIGAIRGRSLYDVPIEVGPEDALLTLSTCIGEDRLVIFARRMRTGETEESLFQAVSRASKH